MKITAVHLFEYSIAYTRGTFVMSGGRRQSSETSLVVKVTTDEGIVGWGETCPHGGTYLPAFHEGERAAIPVLAEAIIGLDPRESTRVQEAMRAVLIGSMAAKSAIDIACWDVAGKAAGLPVAELLGGRISERFRVFEGVTLDTPEAMGRFAQERFAEGWLDLQLKVGDSPYDDAARLAAVLEAAPGGNIVIADANGGWSLQDAVIFARLTNTFDAYVEQPCRALQDCAEVRRRSDLPLIVDECVTNLDDLALAKQLARPGGLNIKPGRVGGLTPARLLRDAAVALGMKVTIDDTWGSALVTTSNSHLAASTPERSLLSTSFFAEWTTPHVANMPRRGADGMASAPTGPGLGVDIDESMLGDPVLTIA